MSLLKFVSDKVQGFEVKRIDAVSGVYVVDVKGYIGIKINDYFSQNGNPYPGNYALVAKGPDYSHSGLGRVTFIDNLQGQVTIGDKTYRTVIMPDGKEWMAENLDYLPEGITLRTSTNKWADGWKQVQCAYYSYDSDTYGWEGKKYGLIYNGSAARALTIAGWHLPTASEWDALGTACGGLDSCGIKLKSTTEWTTGNGTDNWGFTGFPGGYVYARSMYGIGINVKFWSSTLTSSTDQKMYILSSDSSLSNTRDSYINGCYVRLVKDSE